MAIQELTPIINHKLELIHALLDVIETTSPALGAVFSRYLLPEDSERSQKLQATLQIETFAELLTLWTEGIAPELLTQALPYFLEILKHHLTEKGTDDFLIFTEDGSIPLEQHILHYNKIASELAGGIISLDQAISRAHDDVATPELRNVETDLTKLFAKLSENPSWKKKIGMWLLDFRHSSHLDRQKGQMSLKESLDAPNTFIMVANLHEIAHARKNILDLDQKTNGRLKKIVDFTLKMLAARYTGGNNLLANVHAPVEAALEIGTDTVLIGFTYGMGLLARASADPEFLDGIVNQQQDVIDAMTNAARVIREMNDASPTALTVWEEGGKSALEEHGWLRSTVGSHLSPKAFFIKLHEDVETKPELQRYVDAYARQVVDARQGEYNIGLFAASQFAPPNTWESFFHNMDFLAQDYAKTRQQLWSQLNMIDPDAANFIGKMVGYHDGLYRFAKGDFDDPRDIEDLTMHCAQNWRFGFSDNSAERLAVFEKMRGDALDDGHHKKASLLSGMLMTLDID